MQLAANRVTPGENDEEARLLNQELGFSASYMAIKTLNLRVERSPQRVTDRTVGALVSVIESKRFDTRKQALFLFRESAETLVAILTSVKGSPGSMVIPALQKILVTSMGHRHRAVGEALGSLPLSIRTQVIPETGNTGSCALPFQEILDRLDIDRKTELTWRGRSLTAPARNGRTGVIKFVKTGEDPFALTNETGWMDFFESGPDLPLTECDIPSPVKKDGISLFTITDIPRTIRLPDNLHPERFAIVFSAAKAYYEYPNEPLHAAATLDLSEVLGRNARLLGTTAAMGIVHTAVIPLFHNRVQQDRREDGGIYEWERSGRLDRWLESCRHPNFATSGLRDFEHFASIQHIKRLHHHIGSHLLSLILVAGSFFRNRCPEKQGKDSRGNPVDTRQLFDPALFEEAIACSVNAYYLAFTGIEIPPAFTRPPAGFVDALIDEMGVDRHMEEILRVDDQNRMDPDQFERFLLERGLTRKEIARYEKGKAEITLDTGPHLGGFNQGISVPQLIDYIFTCASLMVCGRYIRENGLKESKI
ncbi:MAG: SidJ-related pseudokinase [Desulfobacteraceae bacterium]|nr:SidJ-related pseudokinase [Desulfobacteraceae bacterium]